MGRAITIDIDKLGQPEDGGYRLIDADRLVEAGYLDGSGDTFIFNGSVHLVGDIPKNCHIVVNGNLRLGDAEGLSMLINENVHIDFTGNLGMQHLVAYHNMRLISHQNEPISVSMDKCEIDAGLIRIPFCRLDINECSIMAVIAHNTGDIRITRSSLGGKLDNMEGGHSIINSSIVGAGSFITQRGNIKLENVIVRGSLMSVSGMIIPDEVSYRTVTGNVRHRNMQVPARFVNAVSIDDIDGQKVDPVNKLNSLGDGALQWKRTELEGRDVYMTMYKVQNPGAVIFKINEIFGSEITMPPPGVGNIIIPCDVLEGKDLKLLDGLGLRDYLCKSSIVNGL